LATSKDKKNHRGGEENNQPESGNGQEKSKRKKKNPNGLEGVKSLRNNSLKGRGGGKKIIKKKPREGVGVRAWRSGKGGWECRGWGRRGGWAHPWSGGVGGVTNSKGKTLKRERVRASRPEDKIIRKKESSEKKSDPKS